LIFRKWGEKDLTKKIILVLTTLFFILIFCGGVSATNIPVNNVTGIQNAINTANNGDTLNLSAGTYKEHEIIVDKNLTITGPQPTGNNPPRAVIDAQQQGRVFNILSGVNVTLQYLLIQNGNTVTDIANPFGGGIYNTGTLNVKNCSIQTNNASSGGGIYNTGTLNITGGTINNNTAIYGGGINNDYGTLNITGGTINNNNAAYGGGGIYNTGTLNITGGTINNNNAAYGGGGIINLYGALNINITAINNNTSNYGGGIYNTGTLNISGGTINNNTANYAGGICNDVGTVTVTGTAINNNIALYNGGGIYNTGTLNETGGTINNNTANYGGGLYNSYGTMTLTDSYVDYNTAISGYNSGGIDNDHGTLNIIRTAINFNSGPYGAIRNENDYLVGITINGSAQNPAWHTETVDSPGDVGITTSMALDNANNPHILYYDRYVNTWKYASRENGIWHKETFDNASGYDDARKTSPNSLVLDSQGNPHIIYPSPDGLKYAYKENNIWHIEIVDSNNGTFSSIALDTEGNPHISYRGSADGNLYYRFKSDWGWSNPIAVDSAGNWCPTSIQVDKQDNAHIAYMKNGVGLVYASQGVSSGSFYHETAYSGGNVMTTGQWRALSLALDSQGKPLIAYLAMNSSGCYFEYVYKDSTWHAEELNKPLARDGCWMYYFSIAVDSQGKPHICYSCGIGDSGNFGETSLRYLTQNANGDWNTPIIIDTYPTQMSSSSPYNGDVGRFCSMALDSKGNPYISYYDGINKNLMYTYFIDTTPPSVDVNPVGGAFNAPLIVTLTATDQQSIATIYYTTDGSTPTTNSTQYASPISISTNTTLKYFAVDLAGNPSIVYSQLYTMDMVVPTVNTTDPVNNASNVPPNKVIKVTFSEPIKIGNGLVELKKSGGTLIPITMSIGGNVLTITPTSSLSEALYALILYAGCITDLAGNPVEAKTTNFSVGTSPTVTSTDPANYAVNVAADKVIKVTFNKAIKAGNLNFVVLKTSTGTVIPTTKSITDNVLTITPNSALGEAKYLLLLYAGCVTDLSGNPIAATTRTFSAGNGPVVTVTDPVNYAVNVTRNKVITATFNEPILAKYLTLIYLKTATSGILVSTTKSVSGNTLTITPTSPLAAGTRYILMIYTFAVTDLSGNSNVNKAISFTTGET
jgi:methionine-rich copper-binding protein CopC